MMQEFSHKVYALLSGNGEITAINSSAFIMDKTGWIEIDEGTGDRYHHAQNHYLPLPVTDKYGRCNFRFIDGEIVEIPKEEKPPGPPPSPDQGQRIAALEASNAALAAQNDILTATIDTILSDILPAVAG